MDVVAKFKKAFEFLIRGVNTGDNPCDHVSIKWNNANTVSLYGVGGNILIQTDVECCDALIFGSSEPYLILKQELKSALQRAKTTFGLYVDSTTLETRAFYSDYSIPISVLGSREYPAWPESINYSDIFNYLPNFSEGLSVSYAASLRDHHSYFNYVNITQDRKGFVSYIGTNRHRFSIYTTNKSLLISNILIPTKIARFLFKQRWIDLNQAVCRLSDHGQLLLISDGVTRILIDLGDSSYFPDCEKLCDEIPSSHIFAVGRKKLLDGMASVKASFTKNLIVVFGKQVILRSEDGELEVFLPCQSSSGESVTFVVNYEYFYSAVKSLNGKSVKIITDGGKSKILILGDDVSQKNVIQPVVSLPQYL